ncbi:MAG: serine hydrolase [Thermodesulfovibrionales bacterium]
MKKSNDKDFPTVHKQKLPFYVRTIVLFLLGVISGSLLEGRFNFFEKSKLTGFGQERLAGYTFISPLLICNTPPDTSENIRILPIKHEIERRIASLKDSDRLSRASVYFRLLGTGQWFTVHEQERFSAASLIKLPALIAGLKNQELTPSLIDKKVSFTGATLSTGKWKQNFKPSKALETGREYRFDELLFRSSAYSDNDAFSLLTPLIDKRLMLKTFDDLKFSRPDPRLGDAFVSVNEVANCFRILYNATYLNEKNSEKALDMLSKTDFDKGITRGVPFTTVVAHKFGERGFLNKHEKELHDCGIVYYPGRPYLVCIMTEGKSFEDLSDSIQDLSLIVYNGVNYHWDSKKRQIAF